MPPLSYRSGGMAAALHSRHFACHRRVSSLVTLGEILSQRTTDAAPELVDTLDKNAVRCYSCGHRCKVLDGLKGICKVRYNEDGVLRVPRGYAAALQIDPIEKKPFFHAHPGALALSLIHI